MTVVLIGIAVYLEIGTAIRVALRLSPRFLTPPLLSSMLIWWVILPMATLTYRAKPNCWPTD